MALKLKAKQVSSRAKKAFMGTLAGKRIILDARDGDKIGQVPESMTVAEYAQKHGYIVVARASADEKARKAYETKWREEHAAK